MLHRLDCETAAFLSVTTLVAAGLKGSIDPGLVAFALLYSLSLNGSFQWAVRESAEAETYMTAFERMVNSQERADLTSARLHAAKAGMDLQTI